MRRKAVQWLKARPVRANLALVLLLAAALGNVRLLGKVAEYRRALAEDHKTLRGLPAALRALRASLPSDCLLGYVDDGRPAPACYTAFTLTRYVLAPRRVVRGADFPLVVGNLADPAAEPSGPGTARLTLLRDFGQGVKLYAPRAKP